MEVSNIKAILFDMDGTLIQSLSAVEDVLSKWREMHNIPVKKVLEICHAVASIVTFGYFGIMIGPALIGFIAHNFDLEIAFYILSVGALIMLLNTNLIKKH
ncbi:hypothetical protein [Xenorhabdus kozodoii]|uniref:Haloacid dehalogenase n=1 Tax=Xenorhabdus kozodoii TaxID=351676 RepID=A0A2D0L4W1_9GAMM|nr:hypothetical protein [Xenorhabdus kozodoii]PHM70719.1 haloacid dehalogenase [Xenorhabdus kozodoii]